MADEPSLIMAEMRLERASSTVSDILLQHAAIDAIQFRDAITRIVIALNTMAGSLQAGTDKNYIRDLLWRFGEQIGIDSDASRL